MTEREPQIVPIDERTFIMMLANLEGKANSQIAALNNQLYIIRNMVDQYNWYKDRADEYRLEFYLEDGQPAFIPIEKKMGFKP